jgi:hypothetical protein
MQVSTNFLSLSSSFFWLLVKTNNVFLFGFEHNCAPPPVGRIRHTLSHGPAYLLNLLMNPTEAPSQLLTESQRTEQYFLSESLHAEIVVKRSLDNSHWQKLAGIIDCLTDAGHLRAEESLKSGSAKNQFLDWLPF